MDQHINDTFHITTTISPYDFKNTRLAVGIPIIVITFCRVVSSIVLIYLIRSKTEKFFLQMESHRKIQSIYSSMWSSILKQRLKYIKELLNMSELPIWHAQFTEY